MEMKKKTNSSTFDWLDIELTVVLQLVLSRDKNPNRSWMYSGGCFDTSVAPRQRTAIVPWTGALPHSFSNLRNGIFQKY